MGLWQHQDTAVEMLTRYLQRTDVQRGAALVTMPTGTGKSAVIASLVADRQVIGKKQNALILTPWRGLARQLMEDIDTRTWSRLGSKRPQGLPEVRFVSNAKALVRRLRGDGNAPAIYVATLSMVLEVFKLLNTDEDLMAELFNQFGVVIVDECHYEPAPGWSRAVRALQLPICLFTATPFRNDNRMFAIDETSQYRYSHLDAVSDRILRKPEFVILDKYASLPDYVNALLKVADDPRVKTSDERVMIRCGSSADVRAVADALANRGRTVLGVHETFRPDATKPHLRATVPAPADRPDVEFLVHQNKLTEGFDDPLVRVLAIHGDFGNDRARIQQVGRALRNPDRLAGQRAVVVSSDRQMAETWERYLAFDREIGPRSVAVDPTGLGELLAAQPNVFYWDRRFREKIDAARSGGWNSIRYRLSTYIRRPGCDFVLDEFAADIARDFEASGRQVLAQFKPSDDVHVFLFLTVQNSPILLESAFVEMSLGYLVLHWNKPYAFVSSSSGLTDCIRQRTVPVSAGDLVGLLPEASTVTAMSLTNNDLSDWAIRSRSLRARDLGQIAAEVGDSTFGYSTASGYMKVDGKSVRRYTGVKQGLVTDYRATKGRYEDLYSWFEELAEALKRASKPAPAIGRYGLPVRPVEPPKPAHVLLDVDPKAFVAEDERTGPLCLDWYGGEVKDGSFSVTVNEDEIKVGIRWDAQEEKFKLTPALEVPYRAVGDESLGFWQCINRRQLMSVATEDGLVYSNRNFWQLDLRDAGSETGIMSVLHSRADLAKVTSEKGHTLGQEPWSRSTVFGVLEQDLLPEVLGEDSTILCTDLGSEIADFIGVSETVVVFAHAKSKSAKNASKISASALHEVVAQAMKSLRFLTVGNTDRPETKYWGNDWEIKTTMVGRDSMGPASRLRRGQPQTDHGMYWDVVNRVVQSHAATREVWLVLGACLSKSALMLELAKERPRAHALQVHALLSGAWSSTQQCGVRLRVFCSE